MIRLIHFNYLRIYTAIFLISLFYSPRIIGQEYELPARISVLDPECYSAIVAEVGDIDITAQEFVLNYEFGPAFLKRGKNAKKRYLEVMIYEKLLALEGYSQDFISSPSVKQMIKEIEGDLITEELYKDDIMSLVNVSEQEIDQGVSKNEHHIALKWLYTENIDDIMQYKRQLDRGVSFDSLFAAQLHDSVTIEKRSSETTRFKVQLDNPLLSQIIDTMKVNTYSNPVKVRDGWYIVKITGGWMNVIMTESELLKQKYEIERALFKHKVDELSDQYVHKLMMEENPVIKRKTLNVLQAYIGKNSLRPEKYEDWELEKYINQNNNDSDISNIEKYGNEILVEYKSGKILLKEYVDWYQMRKNYFQYRTDTKNNFSGSIQQTIWKVIRNKLLIERAYRRGLHERESVKQQKKWWLDKLVYAAMKYDIANSISVQKDKLLQYYEENKKDFTYSDGRIIPFDEAEKNVRSEYTRQEYMAKMYRQILKLKQKYDIKINEDVLEEIRVIDDGDPKAIDVYVVKKNGTFPHQAHPTIDWEWRAWF